MKVVFTTLEYFEFGIKMKIFHFLYQNVVIDTELQHLNGVKKRILLLRGQNILQ